MQVFTLPTLPYSLQVSAVLDHFGYSVPHLDQWQQCFWYDLGATQEVYIRCVFAFHEAFPRPPVPQGPSHLLPLEGQLQCRSTLVMGGNSLRPRKVRAQPPSTVSTGPSSPIVTSSPRTEKKKRRKHKSVKRTVTSEMVSPPEKRKKVISESPDSQAEDPFCDTETASAPEGSPHAA